ncbi:MAG TPA: bifunctional nuclease family protein [Phycisphaerales bacterium]|nr:bifunctional nuclease family protein [Phycisphaerales bacterium]
MVVRMELSRILIRELNDVQIIELREVVPEGKEQETAARSFPIVIGLPEAQAIERRLKGEAVKRPHTHDLLASMIEELGASVQSITINNLTDHTFFATIDVLTSSGERKRVDSRPSDAIALGVATGVPIYVEEHVIAAALKDDV